MSDLDPSNKKAGGKQEPKDYTIELPMFDLAEALKLVTEVHEKALETAPMAEVAKGCGYAGPSSTSFYRRIVAARLFGLLSLQGAALTKQSLDYLKPDTEHAKDKALNGSIQAIPAYVELLQNHQGKRINLDIVGNGFMRRFALTKPAASVCARVFANSIKTAGFLGSDGTITTMAAAAATNETNGDKVTPPVKPRNESESEPTGSHGFTLILDPKKNRKIFVQAPPSVTEAELKRIQAWLGYQLLVVPEGNGTTDETGEQKTP